MKTKALLSLVLGFTSFLNSFSQAGDPSLDLTFEEILRLPPGQAYISSIGKLRSGDSFEIHTIQAANDKLVEDGEERGVQVMMVAIKPGGPSAPGDSGYTVVLKDVLVSSVQNTARGSGGGAGKVSMHDISFAEIDNSLKADGSVRIIAVLVGYKINPTSPDPKPSTLPQFNVTTVIDNGTTALLLPAVQKVREAASR